MNNSKDKSTKQNSHRVVNQFNALVKGTNTSSVPKCMRQSRILSDQISDVLSNLKEGSGDMMVSKMVSPSKESMKEVLNMLETDNKEI